MSLKVKKSSKTQLNRSITSFRNQDLNKKASESDLKNAGIAIFHGHSDFFCDVSSLFDSATFNFERDFLTIRESAFSAGLLIRLSLAKGHCMLSCHDFVRGTKLFAPLHSVGTETSEEKTPHL